jgi:hypothetical protein
MISDRELRGVRICRSLIAFDRTPELSTKISMNILRTFDLALT